MKSSRGIGSIIPIAILILTTVSVSGEDGYIDLAKAVVVASPGSAKAETAALETLLEEIDKRTAIRLPVQKKWPENGTTVIAVGTASSASRWAGRYADSLREGAAGGAAEGYRISIETTGRSAPAVLVAGNDPRGVLYGVGALLRQLRMYRHTIAVSHAGAITDIPGRILVPATLAANTAPKFALRGHQMGYRPKVNSYDGWDESDWEQYIRDLAIFGCNAIENMPPRSDDGAGSPHFPRPQIEMLPLISSISDKYDMDFWMWYPAMDKDYSDPATVERALKEWGDVLKTLPRLDTVFVPGGDPGHTQPKYLMALLEKQTEVMHRYHPDAEMWMSPQGFSGEWWDEYFQIMREEQPDWLSGVVYGPQIGQTLPFLRTIIPDKYPLRRYPDITHSLSAQYPVPDWDLAYALTESREIINPRPTDQAIIFRLLDEYSIGFLTYSEGINDDVNKAVWSWLGWDPEADVLEGLRQFSRYFIGPDYTDNFAQGLLSLEENWRGPLLTNSGVYRTLQQFQEMENNATPHTLRNWRFQQALYRAYYDAYVRARLISETSVEDRAMDALRRVSDLGSHHVLDLAETMLKQSDVDRPAQEWRRRIYQLAEALFQSSHTQLDVDLYQAIAVRRGANLAEIDVPLNNRSWLQEQFSEIRNIANEKDRQKAINALVTWTNPGPGGYYDDLGDHTAQPHLVRNVPYSEDPAFFQNSQINFACRPGWRLSWCRFADNLYDTSVDLEYKGLDPNASYKVRIVYSGNVPVPGRSVRSGHYVRLVADGATELHPLMLKPYPVRPVEFSIPEEVTSDGVLRLSCFSTEGRGGAGRGCSIGEVWLIRE
jgi:hypothetical protein